MSYLYLSYLYLYEFITHPRPGELPTLTELLKQVKMGAKVTRLVLALGQTPKH